MGGRHRLFTSFILSLIYSSIEFLWMTIQSHDREVVET